MFFLYNNLEGSITINVNATKEGEWWVCDMDISYDGDSVVTKAIANAIRKNLPYSSSLESLKSEVTDELNMNTD